MNSKNICKFVSNVMDTNLNINCFILETNPEIMMLKYKSVGNRMVLVTKGKGYFNIDREYYEYEKGTLIFIFEGETYSVNFLEETEYMYVDFTGIRAEELFRRFSIRSLNRNFKGFEGLIPLWQESLSRANEKTIDLAAESTLLYTFSRLFGSVAEKNDPVNKAIEALKAAGAKRAVLLPVSAPFHSTLMQPAADRLAEVLAPMEIKDITIPVVANVNALEVTSGEEIKKLLIKQAASPVLWETSVRNMVANGVDTFVEVGPGKVLTGFTKKIAKGMTALNVEDPASLEKTLAVLKA